MPKTKTWKFRVVKSMRGMQGTWVDFPTAATFVAEADARTYAEEFARVQGQAGVRDARISVLARGKNDGYGDTRVVAVYASDAYYRTRGA